MTVRYHIEGQRFGRLVAIRRDTATKGRYVCQCDCGSITTAHPGKLVSGRKVSCGCRQWSIKNNTLEDLLKLCEVRGPDECWPWKGRPGSHGYGVVSFRGRGTTAQRAVYIAVHGAIPKGQIICHRCDNPPCVNPAHLFAGTYHDNVLDMVAKKRGHWQSAKREGK